MTQRTQKEEKSMKTIKTPISEKINAEFWDGRDWDVIIKKIEAMELSLIKARKQLKIYRDMLGDVAGTK